MSRQTSEEFLITFYKTNTYSLLFLWFVSKSQILKIGADEISDHLEEEYQEIIAEFNPDSSTFENYLHKEFLEFLIIG